MSVASLCNTLPAVNKGLRCFVENLGLRGGRGGLEISQDVPVTRERLHGRLATAYIQTPLPVPRKNYNAVSNALDFLDPDFTGQGNHQLSFE